MKFHLSQTVILLNTEFKPAGTAIIRDCNDDSQKYEVDYKYPDREETETLWVPEERLTTNYELAKALYNL